MKAPAIGSVKRDTKQKHYLKWLACLRCHKPRWVRLVNGHPRAEVCAKCAINFTALVCANCRQRWRGPGGPGRCPDCGRLSYPIVLRIPYQKGWYSEDGKNGGVTSGESGDTAPPPNGG